MTDTADSVLKRPRFVADRPALVAALREELNESIAADRGSREGSLVSASFYVFPKDGGVVFSSTTEHLNALDAFGLAPKDVEDAVLDHQWLRGRLMPADQSPGADRTALLLILEADTVNRALNEARALSRAIAEISRVEVEGYDATKSIDFLAIRDTHLARFQKTGMIPSDRALLNAA